MLPRFQVMSVPVSTLAANPMAARASMNSARVTAMSTAKAANRDAKPAYFPCRLSRMMIGRPEGGAPPVRAVMTFPEAQPGQAGQGDGVVRADRCKDGGEDARSSGR